MDKLSVIIVAAGIGKRMGTAVPKQFLLLRDKPIIMHTIEKFYQAFNHLDLRIILVLNANYFDYWHELKQKFNFQIPVIEITGGQERYHSVRNGLELAYDHGIIAVHDGVRPFVNSHFLQNIYSEAKKFNSAVPYTLPKSSVRIEENNQNRPLPRDRIRIIQTPQMFDANRLKQAYAKVNYNKDLTDDATVYQTAGYTVHLVPGLDENIKITTEIDYLLAKILIEKIGDKTLQKK